MSFQIATGLLLSLTFIRHYFGESSFGRRGGPMTIPALVFMVLYMSWMIYSWMFRLIIWRKAGGFIKLLENFRAVEASQQCSFPDDRINESFTTPVPARAPFFEKTKTAKTVPPNPLEPMLLQLCYKYGPCMLIVLNVVMALVDTAEVAVHVAEHGLLEALLRYEQSWQRAIEVAIMAESPLPETWLHYNRILSIVALAANLSTNIVTYYADLLCVCAALGFYLVVKMSLYRPSSSMQVGKCS